MFEIISAANGDLLVEILNGVAMLTDGANFRGMMMLGMVIGLLLVGARALITGRLELQWVLIGWLMYALMFVPKVDVDVEDLGTGNTNVVANVPIGVAAIGTVTSQLGLGMAEAFQTVFATPGSVTGYADSLNTLAAMREPGYGDANDAAAGTAVNVDVQRTISRYLRDCVLYAIAVEDSPLSLTWERLRTSPNLLDDIRVEAVSWWTVTYLDATEPDGTPQTCQAAYAAVRAQLAAGGGFRTEWFEYLGAKLGVDNAQSEVQGAMDHLFGAVGSAQDFMLNALLAKELELADLDYQAAVGNSAGVIMRTQAIEQRRVQWATEKTLFEEMARPLMGYIEGFFYAVSPIMAFIFVLGQFGVMLFGRYLLLAAWIQLWMPIMAVNNLYINHSAELALEELTDGGVNLLSMTGMDSVWTEAASWIAVGGMMAAATPLLALMLLSGSYFAMTQLTNRMAGRDFTNEKLMAPDLMQPAPAAAAGARFSQEAHWLSGHVYGTRRPGAEGVAPQIEWEYEQRKARAETHQRMSSLGEQYEHMRGHAVTDSLSSQEGWNKALSTLDSNQGQFTTMDQAVLKQASQIANRHVDVSSFSHGEQQTMLHSIGLGITSDGAVPFVKFDAGFQQKLERFSRQEGRSADEILEAIAQEAATTDSTAAAYQESLSGSASAMQSSVFAEAVGLAKTEGFQDVARGLEQTSHSLSKMESYIAEIGVEQNMSAIAFGERFKEHKSALEATARQAGVSDGAIDNLAGEMVNYYGVEDPDQARTAAIGVLLTLHEPGAAFGAIAVSQGAMTGDLQFKRALSEDVTGVERPLGAPRTGVDLTQDAIRARHAAGTAEITTEAARGTEGAQLFFEQSQQSVEETAEANVAEHLHNATDRKTQRLLDGYEPVEIPRSGHPDIVTRQLLGMAQTGEYSPPTEGTRSGNSTIERHTREGEEAGLSGDLLKYYVGRSAEIRSHMDLSEEAYPSREDVVAQYHHGEQVVGYVDNAIHSSEDSSPVGRRPSDYLAAAMHLARNPLTGNGGAGEQAGNSTSTPSPGGDTAEPGASTPGTSSPTLGTGGSAAAQLKANTPGETPSAQPADGPPAEGLGVRERATIIESLDTVAPEEAPSASPADRPPAAGPDAFRVASGAAAEPGNDVVKTVGAAAVGIVRGQPAAPAMVAQDGGSPSAGLADTGAPAPPGSAQPELVVPPATETALRVDASPAHEEADTAAESAAGIGREHPEAPPRTASMWGTTEAVQSGSGGDTPTTQFEPLQDNADAPGEIVDARPMEAVQAPAPEAAPPSPEALAEQLYEANIGRGVPESTAWVVAHQAAGAGTVGPEYDRHMQGMQRELASEPKATAAVQNAIDDYAQGSTSSYENHMDAVATLARDARGQTT